VKKLLGILVFLVTFSVSASCPDIKICYEAYDPYQIKIGDKLTGLDFDILEAIASKMSCKVTYAEVPWKRCLAGIESGEFDGTSNIVKTPERDVYANYSDSYLQLTNVFFTLKSNAHKYKMAKMSDVLKQDKFNLGITIGYEYGGEFVDLMKNPKFKAMTEEAVTEEANFMKTADGRINGFYGDEFVGISHLKRLNLMDKIVIHHKLKSTPGFFMFSKKTRNKQFISQFNKALKSVKTDGQYQKIMTKYLK
jgi:polar amino acid transport system substrate-binding protein